MYIVAERNCPLRSSARSGRKRPELSRYTQDSTTTSNAAWLGRSTGAREGLVIWSRLVMGVDASLPRTRCRHGYWYIQIR